MSETQKPFACAREGCKMAFTNEDHLNVHKKKHDMALHLGIDNQNNTAVADQTPTPTRFIRNCEEVGLFQDLQNVNPFDETFRKATELAKTGSWHIPEASTDDSLHTPHIFPHIEEGNNISKFSRNNSNEPEFTVTTINDDLLKLSDENSDDAMSDDSKSDIDIEVLTLTNESSDSEKSERNNFLTQSDPVISSRGTISKDKLISNNVPTAVPLSACFTNSKVSPVIVNNLSEIQTNAREVVLSKKQNCVSKRDNVDGEDSIKTKLMQALKSRVKTEESETDDCDAMVIEEIESSSLFGSVLSPQLTKTAPKRVVLKHSIKDSSKNKSDTGGAVKTRQIFVQGNTQNKRKSKFPVTQSQLERQREINRAAQIRSREKKKYWINQMETEIRTLRDEKRELCVENQNLKNEIVWLKTMLLYHKDCPVARDPQIMQEINTLVKATQDELQKKMQKHPLLPKMVPIRPNPPNLIAVTPVPIPGSMLVQVPASVPVLNSTPVPVSMDSSAHAVQLNSLPALKAKSSTPTASAELTVVPTASNTMPKLIPSSIVSSSAGTVTTHSSLKAIQIPTNSTAQLIIKLPDKAGCLSVNSKGLLKQPMKVNRGRPRKVEERREKKLPNIKVNPAQIITLPNAVLPDDNYFILPKPNDIQTSKNSCKGK